MKEKTKKTLLLCVLTANLVSNSIIAHADNAFDYNLLPNEISETHAFIDESEMITYFIDSDIEKDPIQPLATKAETLNFISTHTTEDDTIVIKDNGSEIIEKVETINNSEINELIIDKINANYITEESIINGYKNLGVSTTNTHIDIMTEPSEDAFVLGRLLDNSACEILEEENNFYKIKSGDVEGYVEKENILTGKEANIRAIEKKEEVLSINEDDIVVYNSIYMDTAILKLTKGDQIGYLEKIDDKYKVSIDSIEGYIYASDEVELIYTLPTAILLYTALEKTQIDMIEYSMQFLGNPYVWGGTSLTNGTDCSGFVMKIYEHFGITIERNSAAQSKQGIEVELDDIKPGDLVFYSHSGGSIDHVAIYIGNGQVIHASSEKTGIKISPVLYTKPVTVKRVLDETNTSY